MKGDCTRGRLWQHAQPYDAAAWPCQGSATSLTSLKNNTYMRPLKSIILRGQLFQLGNHIGGQTFTKVTSRTAICPTASTPEHQHETFARAKATSTTSPWVTTPCDHTTDTSTTTSTTVRQLFNWIPPKTASHTPLRHIRSPESP